MNLCRLEIQSQSVTNEISPTFHFLQEFNLSYLSSFKVEDAYQVCLNL